MAAALKRDLDAEVEIASGHYGEFTVLVDDDEVVCAGPLGFLGVLPSVRTVRDAVASRLPDT